MFRDEVPIQSATADGREPKSCLGRVFQIKLDSFAVVKKVHGSNKRPYLKLKTRPRFCPAS
jgi:hypothetical protein